MWRVLLVVTGVAGIVLLVSCAGALLRGQWAAAGGAGLLFVMVLALFGWLGDKTEKSDARLVSHELNASGHFARLGMWVDLV